MRRIAPSEWTIELREIDSVTKLATPPMPLFLVKEAIAYLGQTRHENARSAH